MASQLSSVLLHSEKVNEAFAACSTVEHGAKPITTFSNFSVLITSNCQFKVNICLLDDIFSHGPFHTAELTTGPSGCSLSLSPSPFSVTRLRDEQIPHLSINILLTASLPRGSTVIISPIPDLL